MEVCTMKPNDLRNLAFLTKCWREFAARANNTQTTNPEYAAEQAACARTWNEAANHLEAAIHREILWLERQEREA